MRSVFSTRILCASLFPTVHLTISEAGNSRINFRLPHKACLFIARHNLDGFFPSNEWIIFISNVFTNSSFLFLLWHLKRLRSLSDFSLSTLRNFVMQIVWLSFHLLSGDCFSLFISFPCPLSLSVSVSVFHWLLLSLFVCLPCPVYSISSQANKMQIVCGVNRTFLIKANSGDGSVSKRGY